MTAVTGMTCQPPRTRLRPPQLAALPDITAALAAQAAGHDRDGSFPADGISLVHDAGLLTATVAGPTAARAPGWPITVAILRALGQGDPSVALVTAMTLLTHAMQAQGGTWPRRIYEEVLQESARRPVLINALRVEPELGTPARGGLPATVARSALRHLVAERPEDLLHRGGRAALDGGLGPHGRGPGPGRQLPGAGPIPRASASSGPGTTWACGPAAATT